MVVGVVDEGVLDILHIKVVDDDGHNRDVEGDIALVDRVVVGDIALVMEGGIILVMEGVKYPLSIRF